MTITATRPVDATLTDPGGPWRKVPDAFTDDPRVSLLGHRLMPLLLRHARRGGVARMSLATLRAELVYVEPTTGRERRYCEDTIRDALTNLDVTGWVDVERRPGRPTLYRPRDVRRPEELPLEFEVEAAAACPPRCPQPVLEEARPPEPGRGDPPSQVGANETVRQIQPPTPTTEDDEVELESGGASPPTAPPSGPPATPAAPPPGPRPAAKRPRTTGPRARRANPRALGANPRALADPVVMARRAARALEELNRLRLAGQACPDCDGYGLVSVEVDGRHAGVGPCPVCRPSAVTLHA